MSTPTIPSNAIDEAVRRARDDLKQSHHDHVNIIVVGGSGVGKSTLLNALFQVDLCVEGTGAPVTTQIIEYPRHNPDDNCPAYMGPLRLIDTRGFESFGNVLNDLRNYIRKRNNDVDSSKHVHIALLCLNAATHRFVPTDVAAAQLFAEFQIPIVIVLTRCYGDAEKQREFMTNIEETFLGVEPKSVIETIQSHWPFARSERIKLIKMIEEKYPNQRQSDGQMKVKKIYEWERLKQRMLDIRPYPPPMSIDAANRKNHKKQFEFMEKIRHLFPRAKLIPVVAKEIKIEVGSTMTFRVPAYGLNDLNTAIIELLDEANKNAYAAAQCVDVHYKIVRAELVLASFSAAAAGIGAIPIPIADAALLVPLEVAMMGAITAVFDLELAEGVLSTVATGALTGIVGTFVGREIATGLLKLIPVLGSVAGALTAVAMTQAFGNAYIAALAKLVSNRKKGDPSPSAKDILKAMEATEYNEAPPKFNHDSINLPDN